MQADRIGTDSHPLVSLLQCGGGDLSCPSESCDQLDNDCDGQTDEGPIYAPWDPTGAPIISEQPIASGGVQNDVTP